MPLSALIYYPTKRELRAIERDWGRNGNAAATTTTVTKATVTEGGSNSSSHNNKDRDIADQRNNVNINGGNTAHSISSDLDDDDDYVDEGSEDPADIFTAALGNIFTDTAQDVHGDPGAAVIYRSARFGDILLRLADPADAGAHRLFAHYLWNASLLVAEWVRKADWNDKEMKERREEERGKMKYGQKNAHSTPAAVDEDKEKKRKDFGYDVDIPVLDLGSKASSHNWAVKGETVLELGAGTALAGITCALSGADHVCITDYPADDVLSTIRQNVAWNCPTSRLVPAASGTTVTTIATTSDTQQEQKQRVQVFGHEWGKFDAAASAEKREQDEPDLRHGFSRVISADCLWLQAQHENLARSMAHFLQSAEDNADARVWVVAGFHTGRARVAAFFDEVEAQRELLVDDIWEVDTEMKERVWLRDRSEDVGERKKWMVVAILKRKIGGLEP